MKSLLKKMSILFVFTILQQGCNAPNKQTTGTVLGGAAGGLVGSMFGKGQGKVLSTGAGALLGAVAGGEVARSK